MCQDRLSESYKDFSPGFFFFPCRVLAWRGRNSRNQREKRDEPICRPAAEDPGESDAFWLDFGTKVNEALNYSGFVKLNMSKKTVVSSSHTERNQRGRHDEDHSQPAESIPSLRGNLSGSNTHTHTHMSSVLWRLFCFGFLCFFGVYLCFPEFAWVNREKCVFLPFSSNGNL